ncbi:MAG TPA: gliding motility-associated C-terminal domain-containing protein, partial [Flavobacteriales bacterium]|nr:gliding motility-associated C-terminal domain-containing protein [Flavobacteriales bacterium]
NTAGTYTYTLTATAPCVSTSVNVTVAITPAPNAGTDNNLTLCDQGAATSLFAMLGGTPDVGGTWSGPSAITGGMYDPATMNPGGYVYTVNGTAPCGSASGTITVNETASPDAGTDGSVTVCSDGAAIDLFSSLGGTPDAGGTWSGGLVNGMFDPTANTAGTYTYTLAATPPCASATSIVTVTIIAAPNAGADNTLTVCDQGAATSLFAALGGTPDAGGTWSGPSAVVGGIYEPATMDPGSYVYTVNGTAPCGSATATVTVSETGSPNAGADGNVTVCSGGAAVDLLNSIGGTPDAGGTWSGPSAITGSMFDPAVNTAGTYTYTVTATPPCVDGTAVVVITISPLHNAGTNAVDTLCTGDAPIDLFNLLGGSPDVGGTWTDPDGNASIGIFDPSTSDQGTYTYEVSGGACPSASATVQMTVLNGPNAGQPNAVALCNAGPTVNLTGLLSGSPQTGGVWTGPDGSTVPAVLSPDTATAGPYTYTVQGNASCPDASAVLTVSISQAVDAGQDSTLGVCSTGMPVNLFTVLAGNPNVGGTWTLAPGHVPVPGLLNPATAASGVYTYTVQGPVPCPADSASIVVTVTQAPDAGADSSAALCSSSANVNMFNLLGGAPDPGGHWTGPGGNTVAAIFDPTTSLPGTYLYHLPAVASCPQDSSNLEMTVAQAANAGTSGDTTLCASGDPFPLMDLLGGTPDPGGVWSGPAPVGSDGMFNPANTPGGTYVYTLTAPAPCPQVSAQVDVVVIPLPVATPSFTMDPGCVPVAVTFFSGYSGNAVCHWDFGNGVDSVGPGPITIIYDQPGTYNVQLSVDPGNGCAVAFNLDQQVVVAAQPAASFTVVGDIISTLRPTAAFDNTSTGAGSYLWDFGGLGSSSAVDPQFTFPYEIEEIYPVCLIAYATPTCTDTVCLDLLVPAHASVFAPNAFSPDGDGINDTFAPVSIGLDPNDYHFIIMDRWGKEVFVTEDRDAAWDGKYSNGNPVPIGVYVWKLTAQDMTSQTRFEHIGHVTLVR